MRTCVQMRFGRGWGLEIRKFENCLAATLPESCGKTKKTYTPSRPLPPASSTPARHAHPANATANMTAQDIAEKGTEHEELVSGGEEEEEVATSRNESKARKALAKLGLLPVAGIARVTVTKSRSVDMYVIAKPEVFKAPTADTYIIFGEAKTQSKDAFSQMAAAAQQQAKGSSVGAEVAAALTSPASAAASGSEEAGEVDEAGVEATDIKMVMEQAGVTRAKAVQALKVRAPGPFFLPHSLPPPPPMPPTPLPKLISPL
jgi:nascent polypeptide-associated complex subunit alpha